LVHVPVRVDPVARKLSRVEEGTKAEWHHGVKTDREVQVNRPGTIIKMKTESLY
jgi:hypothetical protein